VNARTFPAGVGLVLAAALALGATGCGAGNLDKAGNPTSKPRVLTLADGNGDTSDAQPFAAAVWTLSHGTLQIKIEGSWRPGDAYSETGLINDVRAGKAQLGIAASRAFDTVGITSFQALQAPFLIDNITLERKVLDSSIPARMLAGLRPSGLAGLALLPGPLRRPLGFTKPLLAVSDYKGARIGSRPSGVTADMLRALGAIPVTMPRSNSGLGTAGLTGIEAHAALIGQGWDLPGAVLTGNVVFGPRPSVIFMNQRAYAALTASQRGVLLRAAAQARHAGIFQGNDAAAAAGLCQGGTLIVAASPADLAGLRAAVQPVYTMLESNPSTKAYIAQITAMRGATGGAPGAVTCPAHAVPAGQITTTVTPLDGTWQVTYTRAEFVAAGAYPDELLPSEGNWGQLTFTFSRGHFWEIGRPTTAPVNTAYGTYVLAGRKITLYFRYQNGALAPGVAGPYLWSVYKDTLTLKKAAAPGIEIPTGFVVKPWRKIGS
jgi:TRAP-type C4-dicarboxylate transport system substrate-binding protein